MKFVDVCSGVECTLAHCLCMRENSSQSGEMPLVPSLPGSVQATIRNLLDRIAVGECINGSSGDVSLYPLRIQVGLSVQLQSGKELDQGFGLHTAPMSSNNTEIHGTSR